jgi:hypothetical protein
MAEFIFLCPDFVRDHRPLFQEADQLVVELIHLMTQVR